MDDPNTAQLSQLAIEAALSCRWDEALEHNLKLLEIEPTNTDCLNRIAKAYFETGKYSQARKIYNEVLSIDPYNGIAQKNLKRLSSIKKDDGIIAPAQTNGFTISPSLFLQEPGTTKMVNLVKVAEPQKLMALSAGTIVDLIPKSRSVSVTDLSRQYLGALPDDVAHTILKLVKGGNKYQAYIKSVKQNGITILIREIFRSKRFKNQASFLDDSKIFAYSSDHISLFNEDTESADDSESEEVIV